MKLNAKLAGRAALAALWISLAAVAASPVAAANPPWKAAPEADGYKNPNKPTPASIAAGKKVYDKFCVLCHGTEGNGDGPSAKTMLISPATFRAKEPMRSQSDGALAWKILNGRGPMPSWAPVLSEDDIWNVINFIRGFSK